MTTLTEGFPCFFLSCKANARVKPAKTGHGQHSSQLLCCCMYFLCCSTYFCVVLCIVGFVTFSVLFVYICTKQLPPGGYPIAVKYIISFFHNQMPGKYLKLGQILSFDILSNSLLVVVGPVRTDHDQQHCYHHVPTVNQRLLLQLIGS